MLKDQISDGGVATEEVSKQARELLAAEYEREGYQWHAIETREGRLTNLGALRAIDKALSRPSPSLDEVERVARAISIKRHELLRLNPPYWGDGEWDGVSIVLTPNERDRYIEEARAALGSRPSNKSWNEAIEAAARKAEEYPSPLDDLPMALAVRGIANAIRSLVREGEG